MAITDRPKLYPDLFIIWEGFNMLSASRTASAFMLNPISPSDIIAWLDMRGFTSDSKREAYDLIVRLDQKWHEHHCKEQKKKRKDKK